MVDNNELVTDYSSLDWLELPPLNLDTIWAVINESITDTQVNQILWHYLGYRYHRVGDSWDLSQVSPEWLSVYPTPPDFIASRPATVKLTRSIPPQHKQLLKEQLGFKGYKIGEFGPRQTRRATAASWLLAYLAARV
jgi:Domain of unknown function (DUF1823)